MENEEFIKKWLNDSLSEEEKSLLTNDEYKDLHMLEKNLSTFKAPSYDVESELNKLREKHHKPKTVHVDWTSRFVKIAASIIIVFGLIYLLYPSKSTTMVQISSTDVNELRLPDQSLVKLNNESFVLFNRDEWDEERKVILTGEAYFEVEEGSLFEVETASGSVKVLGTSFNVRERDEVLEVSCYSGYVSVEANDEEIVLFKGQKVSFSNGWTAGKTHVTEAEPTWINGNSMFESAPYYSVINEFERQHEVDITLNGIDSTTLFTGTFTNTDLEIGLKSITLPLNLTYQITGDQVVLSKAGQ